MTDNHTFWKFEDPVDPVFPGVTVVPFEIPQIGVQKKIADVKKTTRTKDSTDLTQEVTRWLIGPADSAGFGSDALQVDFWTILREAESPIGRCSGLLTTWRFCAN